MEKLAMPLYSWSNGAFIMIGIFSLVVFCLIGIVFFMMNTDKKKKERD
ncbi:MULTISPECIES: hypothetical protein [Flavobacterium]|nr:MULTISPECIES: hypothetical protein [Flavobacterium]MBN9284981.1 hypothetical protein [Flavobacterium sp.]